MPVRVLAGDIGGTTTRLGIFEVDNGLCRLVDEKSYSSREHDGLEEIVVEFVGSDGPPCRAACFGVAGPVTGRHVRTTNLPWMIDADELERRAKISTVMILNDLEATAWGVTTLDEGRVAVLNPGTPEASGNGVVIAAGTGLGEGGLYWDGRGFRPFACEGGHTSFAPAGELTDRLLVALRGRYGHVSWERVLSGPGLVELYRFMLDDLGRPVPDWFANAEAGGDPAASVSQAALGDQCDVAVRTLELYARLYGEEAGNLALKVMATGGVWVGGGIAPKILRFLEAAFMEGFLAKGRMRPLMESMPVRVILDDRTALRGAARCAATQLKN